MPEAIGAARPIVVRSGMLGRVVAVLLLLLLSTAVLLVITLGHEVDGVGQWLLWVFASVLSLTTILLSVAFLAGGVRLTIRVSGDRLELCRRGHDDDIVGRQDVGLVVLHEGRLEGVAAVEILAADESRLGCWETNWIVKPPPLVMRALKRQGYPYAVGRILYGDRLFRRRPRIPPGSHPASLPWRPTSRLSGSLVGRQVGRPSSSGWWRGSGSARSRSPWSWWFRPQRRWPASALTTSS